MSGLLSLPAELLDGIVEPVLLGEQPPPTTIEEARQTRLSVDPKPRRMTPFLSRHRKEVLYGSSAVASNAAPLLRTNKHPSAKTRQAISRLFPQGPKYKLDVMVVDDSHLWPTWLSVPYLTEQVQSVEVTFRVFGLDVSNNGGSSAPRTDARETIVWCLYALLEQFLHYGPYPSTSIRSLAVQHARHMTTKTIDLRFQTGEHICLPPSDSVELQPEWNDYQRAWRVYEREGGHSNVPDAIGYCIHPA
jgi:hypothetical protein